MKSPAGNDHAGASTKVLRKKQKIDVTAKVAEVPDDRPRREGPAKPGG